MKDIARRAQRQLSLRCRQLRTLLLLAGAISVWAPYGCKGNAERAQPSATSAAAPASSTPSSTAAPRKLVDLVHEAAALLVSSSHQDERSRVEFLGDDQPSTAWRPNPPDPAPWFELRLAHEVEVHSLSVSPLDTEAPRSVELELRSPELGTARWQNERYLFQADRPVRTSSVHVAIKPAAGTPRRPLADAMAFSELQAHGFVASTQVLAHALPEGRAQRNGPVASIDTPAFRNFWRGAPYPTPAALCTAYERAMGLPETEAPNGRSFAYCEVPTKTLKVEGEAPPHVRAVFSGWLGTKTSDTGGDIVTLLMVQTDSGWFAANLWSDNSAYTGICPGMHIARSVIQRTAWVGTVLEQERARLFFPPSPAYTSSGQPGPFDRPVAALSVMRCDVVDRFTCREHLLRYGKPDFERTSEGLDLSPVPPKHWLWQRSFTVSGNDWLRFSPCRTEAGVGNGAAVPCLAPGVSVLP